MKKLLLALSVFALPTLRSEKETGGLSVVMKYAAQPGRVGTLLCPRGTNE